MNTFNRIVLVVLCVGLVAAAVSIIVLTWTIPNRSVNWLVDAAEWVDANDGDLEKALLTTISASLGLIAVIVLLIELIPRSGPDVRVTDLTSGDATLSTAAIGQRIEEAVCEVPHVAEVRASVKAKKKGVIVALDLQVDPEANLATVTDQACQTAQDVLTDRVHVAMLRPPVARLHYRELRLQRRGGDGRRATRTAEPAESAADEATEAEADPADARTAVAVAEPPETTADDDSEEDAPDETEEKST